jgi:lipopolysaccharide biosynthesis regulator YciM
VEIEPDNRELSLHLAAIELERGNVISAVRILDSLLENEPALHARILVLLERYRDLSSEEGILTLLFARIHIKAKRIEQAMMVPWKTKLFQAENY